MKDKFDNARSLFENIKINSLFLSCSWQFEYNGEKYGKEISTRCTTGAKQILVIKDMLDTMKRLLKA